MLRNCRIVRSSHARGDQITARASQVSGQQPTNFELRVCINKTCKRQGSPGVLQFAKDLAIPGLQVESCGCLGQCGNGPNVVILPQEVQVGHVATANDMAELLETQCNVRVSKEMVKATELRQMGNTFARAGNIKLAEVKYTEALNLGVVESYYLLYSNRSGVRLTLGDYKGALEDAQLAVQQAPHGFTTAYIRLIDSFYIQKDFLNAARALDDLVDRNPEFKRTKDYMLISKQLEKDLRMVKA